MRATDLLPKLPALIVTTVLLSPALAHAQMRGNFDEADANHDGHVTLQEFEAYATQRLNAANGPRAQRFKQMSADEQASRLQQRFDKLDKGHKGYLDRSDWSGS